MGIKLSDHLVRFEAGKPYRQPMLAHWCPACQELHPFSCDEPQDNGAKWSWNGDAYFPTFTPSMKIRTGPWQDGHYETCHYFLKGGVIEYLSDCTHGMAGMEVALPVIPADKLKAVIERHSF